MLYRKHYINVVNTMQTVVYQIHPINYMYISQQLKQTIIYLNRVLNIPVA